MAKQLQGLRQADGKKAIITGGDSGIGRAVAIAYAREGADVADRLSDEHDDAQETKRLVEEAGRKAVLVAGDIQDAAHCRAIIAKAVADARRHRYSRQQRRASGHLQGHRRHQRRGMGADLQGQHPRDVLPDQGRRAHMKPGSAIINTASINADVPNPDPAGLCHDQGRDPEFYGGPGADAGRERHPRQCGRAGTDLDAADPFDLAGRR